MAMEINPSVDFEMLTPDEDEEEEIEKELPDLCSLAGLKLVLMIFIILITIQSDIFADRVLGNFSDTSKNLVLTNKGVVLSSFFGCLLMIMAYILVSYEVI